MGGRKRFSVLCWTAVLKRLPPVLALGGLLCVLTTVFGIVNYLGRLITVN